MSPHYTDSRSAEGACWVFDRQLMVHEALGRDISGNPQLSLPLFPSPPLTAPIKPHTGLCFHWHFKWHDLQDHEVDVCSRKMTNNKNRQDSTLSLQNNGVPLMALQRYYFMSSVFLCEKKNVLHTLGGLNTTRSSFTMHGNGLLCAIIFWPVYLLKRIWWG